MKLGFLISSFLFAGLYSLESSAKPVLDYGASVILSITKSDTTYICSGALVSPNSVVTAAHCLVGAISIRATNTKNAGSLTKWVAASFWQINPGYTGNSLESVDIGLIRLKTNIGSTRYFVPTVFPVDHFADYLPFYRVGFGRRVLPTNIRTLVTDGVSDGHQTGRLFTIYDENGVPGDSGGPVFFMRGGAFYLLGVHTGRRLDEHGSLLNYSNFLPLDASLITWLHHSLSIPE